MRRKVQYLSRVPMSAAEEKAAAEAAAAAAAAAKKSPKDKKVTKDAKEKSKSKDDAPQPEKESSDDDGKSKPENDPVKLSYKLQQRTELSKKVQRNFSVRMILLPVLAAVAVGFYKVKYEGLRLSTFSQRSLFATPLANSSIPLEMFDFAGNKYASDIVKINTRKLLTPDPSCAVPKILDTELAHVETALNHANTLRDENKVLLMLNAHNEGLYLEWTKETDCLHTLAETAAAALGADPDYFPNGLRLYNSMGLPITTAEELDVERLAYILIDFQIWVWPGIRVGYTRVVDNVQMKTISLSPLVFDCEGFFNLDEANAIIEHGSNRLSRSPVDSKDAVDGYHSDRTSHTAFLDDSEFTRSFRRRTASLARLPSPSFAERLQLVRYEAGQFFRKHEDYFESKDFLGKKNAALDDYKKWAHWAAVKINSLEDKSKLPEAFLPGGYLFPNVEDTVEWQLGWLNVFLEECKATNFFEDKADVEWGNWIIENTENRAQGIVEILLESKGYMLPYMIKAWEKKANLPELRYAFPKLPVSGVSHYFRWIRWAKERIEDLGDIVPENVRPDGIDYPSYRTTFQTKLAQFILEDYPVEKLAAKWGQQWADWLVENRYSNDVIIDGTRQFMPIFETAVESWTKRAGPKLFQYTMPKHMQHFEPNRFVTLFLYLNDVDEGGETVFPYSKERLVTNIQREGMDECSQGLAVPPTKLHMSLFYGQTWDNKLDPKSLHGGCPPAQGVKFGANSFTWNADADEGSQAWGFGG
ncbi:hypothetical protein LEN26_018944 [Aphanomyces euteiches]|nr:hypothetical protein LEN26_018944 [Aphanomyces euteiches]